jgi:hypothetical protein
VTALSPVIGYQNAAHIAEKAAAEGTTLREAAVASGKIRADEYDRIIVPKTMIGNGLAVREASRAPFGPIRPDRRARGASLVGRFCLPASAAISRTVLHDVGTQSSARLVDGLSREKLHDGRRIDGEPTPNHCVEHSTARR